MMESAAGKFIEDGSLIEVKLLESSPPTMESYILINNNRLNSEAVGHWIDA